MRLRSLGLVLEEFDRDRAILLNWLGRLRMLEARLNDRAALKQATLQLESAIEILREVARLNPDVERIRRDLAWSYAHAGRAQRLLGAASKPGPGTSKNQGQFPDLGADGGRDSVRKSTELEEASQIFGKLTADPGSALSARNAADPGAAFGLIYIEHDLALLASEADRPSRLDQVRQRIDALIRSSAPDEKNVNLEYLIEKVAILEDAIRASPASATVLGPMLDELQSLV